MYASGKKKKQQQQHLPEEIVREEILKRLPIKSLVRFKSVSKSWQSLLLDPNFIKAHLAHCIKQNPNYLDDQLIALKGSKVTILSRFKETLVRRVPFLVRNMLGSINGLVCVSRFHKLSLWNPAINQSKDFDVPPDLYNKNKNINNKLEDEDCIRLLGFGWDHVRNDYKVVACYLSGSIRKGGVYSSNSASWTQLVIPDSVFPNYVFDSSKSLTPTTIVNNCPYWIHSDYVRQMRRKYTALVKFDPQTNEFRLLPEFDYDTVRGKDFDYVNIKDYLAVMVYKAGGPCKIGSAISSVDIYSLDEVSGVWSKMCTMGPINFGVPSWNLIQGFKYSGEILFEDEEHKLLCYDPQTNMITAFLDSREERTFNCFSYTPTLVFISGMKKVQQIDSIILFDIWFGMNIVRSDFYK